MTSSCVLFLYYLDSTLTNILNGIFLSMNRHWEQSQFVIDQRIDGIVSETAERSYFVKLFTYPNLNINFLIEV